jgi:3D (Asp-Asp-Asp) domain-containing protein
LIYLKKVIAGVVIAGMLLNPDKAYAYKKHFHPNSRGSIEFLRNYEIQKRINVNASMYTPHDAGCDGYTATGEVAKYGVVAVPKQVKMGTYIYIEGFDQVFKAADHGGAIKKHGKVYHVDICTLSRAEAKDFGRRHLSGYILKKKGVNKNVTKRVKRIKKTINRT